jgi:hypothetical protein
LSESRLHGRGSEDGEPSSFAGATMLVPVPSEPTGGAYSLLEEVPPLLDSPLHVHRDADELFFRILSDAEASGTIGPNTYSAASERLGITWL